MIARKRVYVAGAYSGPDVTTILGNMRRGLQLAAKALKAGFAVYCPWADCLLHFQEEFSLEECYDYSMPWLEASDAVLLVPENSEQSRGTQAELARAMVLDIPIFKTCEDLIAWGSRQ